MSTFLCIAAWVFAAEIIGALLAIAFFLGCREHCCEACAKTTDISAEAALHIGEEIEMRQQSAA